MSQAMASVVLVLFLTACQAIEASVLDIFPESGVPLAPEEAVCSFDYEPSGSQWIAGVDEISVFLASVKGDGWRLGIGKGGQIYTFRGPFGESVPPQRVESPWNDEVWQFVATNEKLIGPLQNYQNANPRQRAPTLPLMFFIHQAGIYTTAAGLNSGSAPAPFYSPCLRKRWNAGTRTLELVNWIQQARTPCVWKSGLLVYSAYRDCGDGIIEINQVVHNFGAETLTFLNTPWGGVRKSTLPHTVLSRPDGSWEVVDGRFGWTDIPTRPLAEAGGWMAYVQDPERQSSPALGLVFGAPGGKARRGDELIRWGTAGEKGRDYEIAERISKTPIAPGQSLSIRWYLIAGEFPQVRKRATGLLAQARIARIEFDSRPRQSVWIHEGRVVTDGTGDPWIQLHAFPANDTVPVFLLIDKRTGQQILSADPYALAETEPFPNPLPSDFNGRSLYDNRVIYKQNAPHIGYENLLGYAYPEKPAGRNVQKINGPDGIVLNQSGQNLWVQNTVVP
jgi:hypothetical protein